jgi:hypothetical protein
MKLGKIASVPSVPQNSQLSADDVLVGLLDHGLFAEKLPPCFSTRGLAAIARTELAGILGVTNERDLKESIDKTRHDYVRYESLRDINIPRHFGIPHPESYAVQALALATHWTEIGIHLGSPAPAFSRIHVRRIGDGSIFRMSYQGSDRHELEEQELNLMSGAKYIVEADISSCFPSVYSHCIPWALHGKSRAKAERGLLQLTGNMLDKCTQVTRDGQTNGLLIGPHASNIISEIVLTSIDLELQRSGFLRAIRHIDDYRFYAHSADEAEAFIKKLGLSLRSHELFLNEKKTRILPLPRPSDANWKLRLNRFSFPEGQHLGYAAIESFLDLALECAQAIGKSTPLNYAIKTLSGRVKDRKPDLRAKRMYVQAAMNLALQHPYLAPLLDEYVFRAYWYAGLADRIAEFCSALARMGAQKLYPDAIAHALYLALKYEKVLALKDVEMKAIVELDDCVTNVLLFEYAKKHSRVAVQRAIRRRACALKTDDAQARDRQWLLLYQVWSQAELQGNGQTFLATLKGQGFQFFEMPTTAPLLPVS